MPEEEKVAGYTLTEVIRDIYIGQGKNDPSIINRLLELEMFHRSFEESKRDTRGWVQWGIGLTLTNIVAIVIAAIMLWNKR